MQDGFFAASVYLPRTVVQSKQLFPKKSVKDFSDKKMGGKRQSYLFLIYTCFQLTSSSSFSPPPSFKFFMFVLSFSSSSCNTVKYGIYCKCASNTRIAGRTTFNRAIKNVHVKYVQSRPRATSFDNLI